MPKPQEFPQDPDKAVEDLNREAFLYTVAQYKLLIPPKEATDWRACAPYMGRLTGFPHLGMVTILCTNGVVSWFKVRGTELFFGHQANFTGTVVQPFTNSSGMAVGNTGKYHGPRSPAPKARIVVSAEQVKANELRAQMLEED